MVSPLASEPKLPARTLIICNTVGRAVSVHAALANGKPMGCDLLLLHSRFRPPEREEQMKRLKSTDLAAFPKGQIVVATQVIEAGVDLSSAILWSEVAPLASLAQRLGRLNRHGEFSHGGWKPAAIIIGVGVEPELGGKNEAAKQKIRDDNTKRCLPYELPVCEAAWESLGRLNGTASPENLEQIQSDIAASIARCPYSLQRHELLQTACFREWRRAVAVDFFRWPGYGLDFCRAYGPAAPGSGSQSFPGGYPDHDQAARCVLDYAGG